MHSISLLFTIYNKLSIYRYITFFAMPEHTPLQIETKSFASRPKKYRDVRDFMQRNVTESGVLDKFLLAYSFCRHAEHFPVYDKSMLAVYTIPSPRSNHTWLTIYHDTMGMIAQVELGRTLPHFLATFAQNNISVNPKPSSF
jgi:hypothetical protein